MRIKGLEKFTSFFIVLISFVTVLPNVYAEGQLNIGTGNFVFKDVEGNKDKPITVWYHLPGELKPNIPVVFVMHGVRRNGRKYRDSWIKYAERKKFLLLVPEFSQQYYPKSRAYNCGNVFSADGKPVERSKWTFLAIEHLFSYVQQIGRLKTKTYSIYGHSAGAQFVHRLVLFVPDARIKTAICANAGWYTMPTEEYEFPYGIEKTIITRETLKRSFGKKLIVLLGNKDTDENDKYLRKTQEAMVQGRHRFIRGRKFFKTARQKAADIETSMKWRIKTVKGVGHSNSGMSKAAIQFLP